MDKNIYYWCQTQDQPFSQYLSTVLEENHFMRIIFCLCRVKWKHVQSVSSFQSIYGDKIFHSLQFYDGRRKKQIFYFLIDSSSFC